MNNPDRALEYATTVYAAEMEWHRGYEDKVLRYQTVAGSVLGAGALGLAQVQFALGAIAGTWRGFAFLAVVAVAGLGAMSAIVATLLAMAPAGIRRPPVGEDALTRLAAGAADDVMTLAKAFGKVSEEIREANRRRGTCLTVAWASVWVAVAGGVAAFVLALLIPWPQRG